MTPPPPPAGGLRVSLTSQAAKMEQGWIEHWSAGAGEALWSPNQQGERSEATPVCPSWDGRGGKEKHSGTVGSL